MYKIKSEKFNGPLDLLLQLIEKQQLDITEVSIAQVTDQYLIYIETMEEKQADELADFLVIAARLLLLKSKALLPYLEQEEEFDDLEKQLKLYKEFVDASKVIEQMLKEHNFSYSRPKPFKKAEVEFSPPADIKLEQLKQVFLVVLKRLDPLVKLPRQMLEKTISLQQTIFDIKDYLNKQKKMGFNELMGRAQNKTEVIMNFLALLELVKQQQLTLRQASNFEDIIIEKI